MGAGGRDMSGPITAGYLLVHGTLALAARALAECRAIKGEYQEVLARVDHRNLNCDLPELKDRVATTENLASVIEDLLTRKWSLPARLARVRISETARNTFELETK